VVSEASAIDTSYTMAHDHETPNPLHTDANNQSTLRQRTGSTIHILDGPKIFCDASVCLQGSQQQCQISIGIFILTTPTHTLCSGSFIQVAIHQHMDPLLAEAQALLLGTKIADALNLLVANILTDCQVLASAVEAGSYRHRPGHWSIRPAIAEIEVITRCRQFSVINISRDKNKTADRLAKLARQASIPNSCLFSCVFSTPSTM
jgi:hypothetical protein